IGAGPAIVALFLYSLLPILRGTHAGLAGIAPELRESAEALGLPRSEVLRRIELPLAAPSILSGIKTAAVIDVVTAPLGALHGAGRTPRSARPRRRGDLRGGGAPVTWRHRPDSNRGMRDLQSLALPTWRRCQ